MSSFFILFTDILFTIYYLLLSFEMFPKHREVTTTAESFALNFTIPLPLTDK